MTEGLEPQTPSRRTRVRSYNWLAGRAGKPEYWVWVAGLFALSFALSFLPISGATGGLTGVLMIVQIRRFHDVGRTGWWALAATLAPLVAVLPLMISTSLTVSVLVGTVVELGLIVWIGVMRGDAGENRFGPPPPTTLKAYFTGR